MATKKPTLTQQLTALKAELHDLKNMSRYITPIADSNDIINTYTSRIYRYQTDLLKWREALNYAENIANPLHVELVRIYNEMLLDPFIINATEIRKSYILSRDWKFEKNGLIDQKSSEFFNKRWFNQFVEYVLDSIFFGYSLIQIGDIVDDELLGVKLIQRQNVSPQWKKIMETPYALATGVHFTDPELTNWYVFATDSENTYYEGLFAKIAPYQIIHKVSIIAYNDYVNRFGQPNIVAKTSINDESALRNLEKYLANFNNKSFAIVGQTDEVQILESNGKSSDVYVSIVKMCSDAIYKMILGSPLSDEQTFVGSADIRESLANLYSLKDLQYVEHYVNCELIPKLINLGLTWLKDVKFIFDVSNKMDPKTQFEQVIALLNTGQGTVPAEWIEKTFGIPWKSINPIFDTDNSDNDTDTKSNDTDNVPV